MKLFVFGCVLLSLALAFEESSEEDYCDESLCRGRKHIACNNNNEFAAHCSGNKNHMVELTPQLQADIVHRHNEKRNKIASGKQSPYKPAARMATMSWNDELAHLAELNAKTCIFAHDCHNTKTFHYSGQNLGFWGSYPAITVQKAIEKFIEMWYSEHTDADMSVINNYYRTRNPTGHFTIMMADRNIQVGCAMRKSDKLLLTEYYFTCNYATTNVMNFPIYKAASRPASGCKTGTNPQYPALCSSSEEYDVNTWF